MGQCPLWVDDEHPVWVNNQHPLWVDEQHPTGVDDLSEGLSPTVLSLSQQNRLNVQAVMPQCRVLLLYFNVSLHHDLVCYQNMLNILDHPVTRIHQSHIKQIPARLPWTWIVYAG